MLPIPCPHCGPRDEAEFIYGGDAKAKRPAMDAPDSAWIEYVFLRDNPRGPHRELWWHSLGCRRWLVVERDTLTHEIFGAAEPGADT
ncbi:MAG TPA: sarcosine oxidase subunit delta [Alphaproteobacteria bacterium]|nr:sarcosine oxidase subunit delta [Alphaproteobacteria bacterium]